MKSLVFQGIIVLAFLSFFLCTLSAQCPSPVQYIELVVIWPEDSVATYLQALEATQLDISSPSGARLIRMPSCNTINLNGQIYSYDGASGAVGVVRGTTEGVSDDNFVIYYPEEDGPNDPGDDGRIQPLPLFACPNPFSLAANLTCPVGSQTTRIAILDTGEGIQTTNVNQSLSYNFVDNNTNVQTPNAHGPMVLSIVNRFQGIQDILILKVLDDTGHGKLWYAIKAIDHAIQHNVHLISMSFVAIRQQVSSASSLKTPLGVLINNARIAKVLCLSAAGNDHTSINRNTDKYVPAAEYFTNNFPIGASDCMGAKAIFSNEDVLTAFVGVDVVGYDAQGQAIKWSGTSFSTPIVAGMIAQLWSNFSLQNRGHEALAIAITRLNPRSATLGANWPTVNTSEGNIHIGNVYTMSSRVLAIAHIDLNAQVEGNNVKLAWQIAENMKKINHFDIQKLQTSNNFVSFFRLSANDNQRLYEWTDKNSLSDINCYRIVVTYDNGLNDTTKAVSVERGKKGDYQVFPNPVSDILYIHSNTAYSKIMLMNIATKHIELNYQQNFLNNSNDFSLNVAHLSNGVYELMLITKDRQVQRQKIVIMR